MKGGREGDKIILVEEREENKSSHLQSEWVKREIDGLVTTEVGSVQDKKDRAVWHWSQVCSDFYCDLLPGNP